MIARGVDGDVHAAQCDGQQVADVGFVVDDEGAFLAHRSAVRSLVGSLGCDYTGLSAQAESESQSAIDCRQLSGVEATGLRIQVTTVEGQQLRHVDDRRTLQSRGLAGDPNVAGGLGKRFI